MLRSALLATSRMSRKKKIRCRRFECTATRRADHEDVAERRNEVGIQMLPDHIWKRIFRSRQSQGVIDADKLKKVEDHLTQHNLSGRISDTLADIELEIPELLGEDLEEHFRIIGEHYTRAYTEAVADLIGADVPSIPKRFAFKEGWVRYATDGNTFESVEHPEGDALVFDVETIVTEGGLPAIAAALSRDHWYTWCSGRLVAGKDLRVARVTPDILIPLGSAEDREQVVAGHHVGFDRSFVREEYDRQCSKRRFLDTLSMHVCISGRTNGQRIRVMKSDRHEKTESTQKNRNSKFNKANGEPEESWKAQSAANSLAEVYRFYCKNELDKSQRKTFEEGTSDEVRANFQELMMYCVFDVKATRDVLVKLWPIFRTRLPHPVSLFGFMEMLTAYLPVNENWNRYLSQADAVYHEVNTEVKLVLNTIANRACRMTENEAWKKDPWLWDLKWDTTHLANRKISPKNVSSPESILPKQSILVGYPKWYRELCNAMPKEVTSMNEWDFGAWDISMQTRCVPKLMKLLWNNYPLHYDSKHGWGYLVPIGENNSRDNMNTVGSDETQLELQKNDSSGFPFDEYKKLVMSTGAVPTADGNYPRKVDEFPMSNETDDGTSEVREAFSKSKLWRRKRAFQVNLDPIYNDWNDGTLKRGHMRVKEEANGDIGHDIGIPGVLFKKLPHKNGPGLNVGSPLSKDFMAKFDDKILRSWENDDANTLLKLNKQKTYWMCARDRLIEQMVVWTSEKEGVILPRLMPAGTVSRRAVERTWLTASNAKEDRIGSELKAMIQAPPGMHFVGADVDSQELWIASLLGDSSFAGIHGCTAFGWMTLQGKKSEGTDMHSRTAATAGCSRDHAKVLNYARIYGAGRKFSASLLRQFNPNLSETEAELSAQKMFLSTKGKRDKGNDDQWKDGTESHMFNKLEQIASSSQTMTPVLGAQITRALESKVVGKSFMTSRVNWTVQSSAVDYLHLMLASMKDLSERFRIDVRLVVSIHDEVRFLVRSENRYRAALALHITNLLVRSFFAMKVGMNDLPYSVAFFSAVDVDKVIRKDVTDDSITPSNPHGLSRNYGIPFGEELDIYETIELTNGGKLIDRDD